MKLTKNVEAPHFKLNDMYGRAIDLNDYRDKKVFIGFFRHAGCPIARLCWRSEDAANGGGKRCQSIEL